MIVLLSVQIFVLKRDGAILRASAELSTREFLQGAELPALVLDAGRPTETSLRTLCRPHTPTLIVFTQRGCPFSDALEQTWTEIARDQEIVVVAVYNNGTPRVAGSEDTEGVVRYSASPTHIRTEARLRSTPAVIVTDGDCRIDAAGAGFETSRLVLRTSPWTRPTSQAKSNTAVKYRHTPPDPLRWFRSLRISTTPDWTPDG